MNKVGIELLFSSIVSQIFEKRLVTFPVTWMAKHELYYYTTADTVAQIEHVNIIAIQLTA